METRDVYIIYYKYVHIETLSLYVYYNMYICTYFKSNTI